MAIDVLQSAAAIAGTDRFMLVPFGK